MKKRIGTLLLVLTIIISQLTLGIKIKAEGTSFSVQVLINSFDKVLAEGVSGKNNALEALKDIASKNGMSLTAPDSSYGGKYVKEVAGVSEKHFGGSDGWMYAVLRNGEYTIPMTSIDTTVLQNGDKIILYYGQWDITKLPNNVKFSYKLPGTKLTVTLENSYEDWSSGTPVVKTQPISNVKTVLDGKEYTLSGNTLVLEEGLAAGQHTLELSDWKTNGCPGVVHDKIKFEINNPEATIRVEGLNGTIAEGKQRGKNVLEMLENLLKGKNIQYTVKDGQWGKYVEQIDRLKAGKFGGYDGWMCYYKSAGTIDRLPTGLDSYIPTEGDTYVVYYGDYSLTLFVNAITFTPDVVKENEGFSMKFALKELDWSTNQIVEKPIVNAIVTIDGLNYITNENGIISIEKGLAKGEHAYKVSGYSIDKLPTVVMDKGIFIIDNEHSPSFNYDNVKYEQIDNTTIKKDINSEIASLKNYISNNTDDPWASLILQKFGIKGGETYIKQMAGYISEEGLSECTTTDLEKLILNLAALGYNPYNFMGKDLVAEVFSRDESSLLINDAIFGLIVYNYANVSGQYKLTEDKLIDFILKNKLNYTVNGKQVEGWALSGDKINPDITGAVLSALAPFSDDSHPEVKAAIAKAVDSLSILQDESGYLADSFGRFSESLSFVIIGLTAVGENPEGYKFTKSKGDLVSALLSFKGTNGQFKHILDGGNDYMATEQALRALYSLQQYKNTGKYDFYKNSADAKSFAEYPYLPKTGAVVDNFVLMVSGVFFIVAGLFMVRRKSKA